MSKLARKARRVARSSQESEFSSEMGKLRTQRDNVLRAINAEFDKQHAELLEKRVKARKKANDTYDEKRNELVVQYAAAEAEEAVA